MRDQYTDTPGTYLVDNEAGIRIPEADWEVFQFNKTAYVADPGAARKAFELAGSKKTKPKSEVITDDQL